MTASPAQRFASLPRADQIVRIETLTEDEAAELVKSWRHWLARPEQLPPDGEWFTWLVLAGRGFGKSRTASEWIVQRIIDGDAKRIALVARTAADCRDVLIEGQSGILAVARRLGVQADYEPSKRRVTFPLYSAVATAYSAEQPDQLRGPEHDTAIADELASWPMGNAENNAWSNLLMGLRIGNPRVTVTTTPRPTATIKTLVADPKTAITRGSTYDNAANLAASFLDEVKRRYEGTRIGRQELLGEVLSDVEGALFRLADIDAHRVQAPPRLQRIVVAVDPAVTANADSDYTAICVSGLGPDNQFYVLHSEHVKASPSGWATRVLDLHDEWNADRIVAERNNGGDLVEHTIRTIRPNAPLTTIHASRGKQTRAEPVAALVEQGKVHFVGIHKDLEDELTVFPVATDMNDDLVDAFTYAVTELDPYKTQSKNIIVFKGGRNSR